MSETLDRPRWTRSDREHTATIGGYWCKVTDCTGRPGGQPMYFWHVRAPHPGSELLAHGHAGNLTTAKAALIAAATKLDEET